MAFWIGYGFVVALLAIPATLMESDWRSRLAPYALCAIWPVALVAFVVFVVLDELDQRRWRTKYLRSRRDAA